ncbi:MAG: thiol:disulfide interchange protein DsbA/DsbL [Endozoicomonas sp.]
MHKWFHVFWVALLIPLVSQAAPIKYKEGQHYRELRYPVQTSVGKEQVEVSEVFWYGCPHCFSLEPIVNRWKPSLAKDVKFVRVPGFFSDNIWQDHAKLYHTIEVLYPDEKKMQEVHDAIFPEIQNRNNRLNTVGSVAEFLNRRFGADKKEVTKIYNSPGVTGLLSQSFSKSRGYQVTGVPAIVVDGRYVIDAKVGLNNMPVIADFLVQKVRDDRGALAKEKNSKKDSDQGNKQ